MLKMIDVDTVNGTLSSHGEVEHSGFYNQEGLSSWWSGTTSIRRSVFMGDFIYSFSSGGATVHRTADLNLMVELDLPGNEPYEYYSTVDDPSEPEKNGTAESSGDEVNDDGGGANACSESDGSGCEG